MEAVGIRCEYNPCHNGHVYHINKIKEMFPDDIIVLVLSGNFTQRGDVSIIDKWDKTDIALDYVDLVVELPFVFSVQSADNFARGSISILKSIGVSKIVFGTETLDAEKLEKIASIQKSPDFNSLVKEYLNSGVNYPTALSKSVYDLCKIKISNPNDLLGLSYVKELENSSIKIFTIKRTNNYHDKDLSDSISSATSIREAILNKKSIKKYVPLKTYNYISKKVHFNNDYFDYLKYKIISELDCLDKYLYVDEGIENRIKKYIYDCSNLDELIDKIKTKRYTYNKINRMFTYILCGFTKEMANEFKYPEYIRILGFNENGQKYLRLYKKKIDLPIITKYTNKYKMLNMEMRVSYIYYMNEKNRTHLTLMEYKRKPIIK